MGKFVMKAVRKHRLYNGDCLDVLPTLPDESVDFVCVDPPYGISLLGNWQGRREKNWGAIDNDDKPFVGWVPETARVLKDKCAVVCFCRWDVGEVFRKALDRSGLRVVSQIIWDKKMGSVGDLKGTPCLQHEMAWLAVKGRFVFPGWDQTAKAKGRPNSLYRFTRPPVADNHPTEKPTTLLRRLIEDYCPDGGVVLDPCMGSGSTIVAAAEKGCVGIGVEVDTEKGYFRTAVRRVRTSRETHKRQMYACVPQDISDDEEGDDDEE